MNGTEDRENKRLLVMPNGENKNQDHKRATNQREQETQERKQNGRRILRLEDMKKASEGVKTKTQEPRRRTKKRPDRRKALTLEDMAKASDKKKDLLPSYVENTQSYSEAQSLSGDGDILIKGEELTKDKKEKEDYSTAFSDMPPSEFEDVYLEVRSPRQILDNVIEREAGDEEFEIPTATETMNIIRLLNSGVTKLNQYSNQLNQYAKQKREEYQREFKEDNRYKSAVRQAKERYDSYLENTRQQLVQNAIDEQWTEQQFKDAQSGLITQASEKWDDIVEETKEKLKPVENEYQRDYLYDIVDRREEQEREAFKYNFDAIPDYVTDALDDLFNGDNFKTYDYMTKIALLKKLWKGSVEPRVTGGEEELAKAKLEYFSRYLPGIYFDQKGALTPFAMKQWAKDIYPEIEKKPTNPSDIQVSKEEVEQFKKTERFRDLVKRAYGGLVTRHISIEELPIDASFFLKREKSDILRQLKTLLYQIINMDEDREKAKEFLGFSFTDNEVKGWYDGYMSVKHTEPAGLMGYWPYVNAIISIASNENIRRVQNKLEKGEELSEIQNALLKAYQMKQQRQRVLEENSDMWFTSGRMTAQSVAWLGEMFLTRKPVFSATVRSLARPAYRKIRKLIPNITASKWATRGITTLMGGAAMTGTHPHGTLDRFSKEMIAPMKFAMSEDGDEIVTLVDKYTKKEKFEKFYQSFLVDWGENWTEMSGYMFIRMGKFAKQVFNKPFLKRLLIAKLVTKYGKSNLRQYILKNQLGFHGFLPEFGEEIINMPWHNLVTGNRVLGGIINDQGKIDWDNLGAIATSIAPQGFGFWAFGRVGSSLTKSMAKKSARRSYSIAYNPPTQEEIKSIVRSTNDKIKKAETGKPFEATLLRGTDVAEDRIIPYMGQLEVGPGVFGHGTKKAAKIFGQFLSKHGVKIKNPLVIENDEEYRRLLEKSGIKDASSALVKSTDGVVEKKATEKNMAAIKWTLMKEGHDGIIFRFPSSEKNPSGISGGKSIELLQELFKDSYVISFGNDYLTEEAKLKRDAQKTQKEAEEAVPEKRVEAAEQKMQKVRVWDAEQNREEAVGVRALHKLLTGRKKSSKRKVWIKDKEGKVWSVDSYDPAQMSLSLVSGEQKKTSEIEDITQVALTNSQEQANTMLAEDRRAPTSTRGETDTFLDQILIPTEEEEGGEIEVSYDPFGTPGTARSLEITRLNRNNTRKLLAGLGNRLKSGKDKSEIPFVFVKDKEGNYGLVEGYDPETDQVILRSGEGKQTLPGNSITGLDVRYGDALDVSFADYESYGQLSEEEKNTFAPELIREFKQSSRSANRIIIDPVFVLSTRPAFSFSATPGIRKKILKALRKGDSFTDRRGGKTYKITKKEDNGNLYLRAEDGSSHMVNIFKDNLSEYIIQSSSVEREVNEVRERIKSRREEQLLPGVMDPYTMSGDKFTRRMSEQDYGKYEKNIRIKFIRKFLNFMLKYNPGWLADFKMGVYDRELLSRTTVTLNAIGFYSPRGYIMIQEEDDLLYRAETNKSLFLLTIQSALNDHSIANIDIDAIRALQLATFAHELLHGFTDKALRKPVTQIEKKFKEEITKLFHSIGTSRWMREDRIKRVLRDHEDYEKMGLEHAMASEHEFVANIFENTNFLDVLSRIPAPDNVQSANWGVNNMFDWVRETFLQFIRDTMALAGMEVRKGELRADTVAETLVNTVFDYISETLKPDVTEATAMEQREARGRKAISQRELFRSISDALELEAEETTEDLGAPPVGEVGTEEEETGREEVTRTLEQKIFGRLHNLSVEQDPDKIEVDGKPLPEQINALQSPEAKRKMLFLYNEQKEKYIRQSNDNHVVAMEIPTERQREEHMMRLAKKMFGKAFPNVEVRTEEGVERPYINNDGTIILPSGFTFSDAMSQYAILLTELAKNQFGEFYRKGLLLIEGTTFHDEAMRTLQRQQGENEETYKERILQYALSSAIADEGQAILRRQNSTAAKKMIQWVKDLMLRISRNLGIKPRISGDDFYEMTLGDFTRLVSREIMIGFPITEETGSRILRSNEQSARNTRRAPISVGRGTIINPADNWATTIQKVVQEWFYRRQGLPNSIYERLRGNEAGIKANLQEVTFLVRDIQDRISKYHTKTRLKSRFLPLRDPKLPVKINQYLKGEIPAEEIEDEQLVELINRARRSIDLLSDEIKNVLSISSDMEATIDAHMGIYLNRSYRIHDQESLLSKWLGLSWRSKVADWGKLPQQIRDNAILSIVHKADQGIIDEIDFKFDEDTGRYDLKIRTLFNEKRGGIRINQQRPGDIANLLGIEEEQLANVWEAPENRFTWKPNITISIGNRQYYNPGSEEMLPVIDQIQRPTDDKIISILRGMGIKKAAEDYQGASRVGRKDLGILAHRKEIPEPVRVLMGEEQDPFRNLINTVARQSQLIQSHKFLTELKAIGMNNFLFTAADRTARATEKIAGRYTRALAPLNGLYTTPEINRTLQNFYDVGMRADWQRALQGINGVIKGGFVVWNVVTQIRNFLSWAWIHAANQQWDLKYFPVAWKTAWTNMGLTRSKEEFKRNYTKMTRLGVSKESVGYEDFRRFVSEVSAPRTSESFWYNYGKQWGLMPFKFLQGKISGVARTLERFYLFSDDVNKIYFFYNERNKLDKAYPSMTEDEKDNEAARKTRLMTPTYSEMPKMIQKYRRFPFLGPFVAFPTTMYISGYQTMMESVREQQSGISDKVGRTGFSRMVSASLMYSPFVDQGLQKLSMALSGIDDEEMDNQRIFFAPWDRNASLFILNFKRLRKALGLTKPYQMAYVNISYVDPMNNAKKPIIALFAAENPVQGFRDFLLELAQPFIQTEPLVAAFEEMERKGVFKKDVSTAQTMYNMVSVFLEEVQPGMLRSFGRFKQSLSPTVAEREISEGYQYDPVIEAVTMMTGQRIVISKPRRSLIFKSMDWKDGLNQIRRRYYRLKNNPKIGPQEFAEGYMKLEDQAYRKYQEINEIVISGLKIGIAWKDIKKSLKDGGLDKYMVDALEGWRFPGLYKYVPKPVKRTGYYENRKWQRLKSK